MNTTTATEIARYFDTITNMVASDCSTWAITDAGKAGKANSVHPAEVTIAYAQFDPRDGDEPICWMVNIPVKINPRRKAAGWMSVRGTGETPEGAAADAVQAFKSHHGDSRIPSAAAV